MTFNNYNIYHKDRYEHGGGGGGCLPFINLLMVKNYQLLTLK